MGQVHTLVCSLLRGVDSDRNRFFGLTPLPKGTGYKAVKLIHGKYYAKASVDPYPAPQRTLPGGGWETAREAAIHLARYNANPWRLPDKRVQRPRGKGQVRAFHASRLATLTLCLARLSLSCRSSLLARSQASRNWRRR